MPGATASQTTLPRELPSAILIPNSRVLSTTEFAAIPYTPTSASDNARSGERTQQPGIDALRFQRRIPFVDHGAKAGHGQQGIDSGDGALDPPGHRA
jgi:hypothetical protein